MLLRSRYGTNIDEGQMSEMDAVPDSGPAARPRRSHKSTNITTALLSHNKVLRAGFDPLTHRLTTFKRKIGKLSLI